MNTEEVGEFFKALNDTRIRVDFGRDACTNIPNPGDPDDTSWHLKLHDEQLFKGKEDAFNRILKERGLECKYEEFLGWHHMSIYRPGYKFPCWKSHGYKF